MGGWSGYQGLEGQGAARVPALGAAAGMNPEQECRCRALRPWRRHSKRPAELAARSPFQGPGLGRGLCWGPRRAGLSPTGSGIASLVVAQCPGRDRRSVILLGWNWPPCVAWSCSRPVWGPWVSPLQARRAKGPDFQGDRPPTGAPREPLWPVQDDREGLGLALREAWVKPHHRGPRTGLPPFQTCR